MRLLAALARLFSFAFSRPPVNPKRASARALVLSRDTTIPRGKPGMGAAAGDFTFRPPSLLSASITHR